jgi:hypothetical protein
MLGRVEKERAGPDIRTGPFQAGLELYHVRRFRALGARNDIERHFLAFGQRLEAAVLNVGKVHKNISAIIIGNESKTLGIIEPLHGSFCHVQMNLLPMKIEDNGNVHKKNRKVFHLCGSLYDKDFRNFSNNNTLFPADVKRYFSQKK